MLAKFIVCTCTGPFVHGYLSIRDYKWNYIARVIYSAKRKLFVLIDRTQSLDQLYYGLFQCIICNVYLRCVHTKSYVNYHERHINLLRVQSYFKYYLVSLSIDERQHNRKHVHL